VLLAYLIKVLTLGLYIRDPDVHQPPWVLEFQVEGRTAARFPIEDPEEGKVLARQLADRLEASAGDFCQEHSIPDHFRKLLTAR
jgi:hypothetical protein